MPGMMLVLVVKVVKEWTDLVGKLFALWKSNQHFTVATTKGQFTV